jgi:probable DNA repair protein
MGTLAEAEIDGWLRDGGPVITASARAARALQMEFHQRRRAEGFSAWPAPNIQDWSSFVSTAWEARACDGRMLLNPAQEQALWAEIAGAETYLATILPGPLHRLAAMATEAHELLCSYAPHALRETARSGWDQDAGAFSGWLRAFDTVCREANLLSPSRAALELIALLQADTTQRPPLLATGFDRLLPVQKDLFDAWGTWQQAAHGEAAREVLFQAAGDTHTELDACVLWCQRQLVANPRSRLLVLTQDIAARRGELERAFLRCGSLGTAPLFEFSLGIPLNQVPLPRGALLLLRWLNGPHEESELDWLISTGQAAMDQAESTALQAAMRALRRRGLERTQWTMAAFSSQIHASGLTLASWIERMRKAQRLLLDFATRRQSPLEWATLVPRLLQAAGWLGDRRLSSAEFQAYHRWEQALDTCGSLSFDGSRIGWQEFLGALARTMVETLFAPESSDAPIQIAGPAESAGLTADAIWFLGADEDTWPASGSMHPLLPPQVQREAGMPHATPRLDWELAQSITTRLLSAAPVVHFSYAAQERESEARPSRLIVQLAGPPQPLPAELAQPPIPPPVTVSYHDFSRVPFPRDRIEGGSSVLTAQSQCPFKAFATARLGAQSWQPAEAGLTAAQRGQLLHAVLHGIWAGPPQGLRTLNDLLALADRKDFVEGHVRRALREKITAGVRERMPRRYLELEEQRLTRLISEWLGYEATRLPFTVEGTEVPGTAILAGLALSLRLDRIDRLNDGSLLVIDYKTGDVKPKSWDLPRPDDVQLPLYAGFALNPDANEELGGLVFAKVRPGERIFAGRVGDANGTLFAGLKGSSALVKEALTAEQLIAWREYIEQLAKDFLAGRAEVDPREAPKTCERCGLQTLCRIQENQGEAGDDSEEDGDE